ncbi:MAG: hypothetical protein MZV70_76540 [Desulfobacterales bacterium]|nr:hypothetical protein [Desulfobacterales bacterium]
MTDINLQSFLKFGYFLDFDKNKNLFDFKNIDKNQYKNLSEIELIKLGSAILKDAIKNNINHTKKYLVPISGGLDSRAILAGLLEFVEPEKIYTCTFWNSRLFRF